MVQGGRKAVVFVQIYAFVDCVGGQKDFGGFRSKERQVNLLRLENSQNTKRKELIKSCHSCVNGELLVELFE